MTTTRRQVLGSMLAGPLLLAPRTAGAAAAAPLTPACGGHAEPTAAQTEGPYFLPGSPRRQDLASDVAAGSRILLVGLVLDPACRPQPGALVELWHADAEGRYDVAGHRLRGHQFTDAEGAWRFETIVPAAYPGRTRHYHVKVQRRGGAVLTTQLYFPDDAGNRRDRLFDQRLLLARTTATGGEVGRFDFVVA